MFTMQRVNAALGFLLIALAFIACVAIYRADEAAKLYVASCPHAKVDSIKLPVSDEGSESVPRMVIECTDNAGGHSSIEVPIPRGLVQ